MRGVFSAALVRPRAAAVAGRALSLGALAGAIGGASMAAVVARRRPDLGMGPFFAGLAFLGVLALLSARWFLFAHRAVARLGRRPEPSEGEGLSQAARHACLAAEEAFDRGGFSRVAELLGRVPERERSPAMWSLEGRALALAGDPLGADGALERGAASRAERDVLLWRGLQGFPDRIRRLPAMALASGALFLACLGGFVHVSCSALAPDAPQGFDESAFRASRQGAFTFYYHDAAFLGWAAPLAQAALDHDLAFLGLPAGAFAPGSLRVYLCADRAEYRRRAPYDPPWESACADPPRAAVYVHAFAAAHGGRAAFEVTLAHEIGHVCLYRLVGSLPDDWLNEGTADYLGYSFGLDREGVPREAWLQERYFQGLRGRALPFGRFFTQDPHALPSNEVATFYRQGFSVVYMLVEDYGRGPFLAFLRAYARDGGDADRALASTYPTIPDTAALAAVWGVFYPGP